MLDKIIDLGFKDILSSLPSEFVTLNDAVQGKNKIKLKNGFIHEMDKNEILKLSNIIPLYLWALIKVPFIILKLETPGEYTINGSEWDKKALSIVLNKDTGKFISSLDVEKLMKDYKSLIFITLSYSIFNTSDNNIEEGM
ncbi:DUF61 family protein [Acidianus brierleyi]|uniref:DUF61 domain-containing protein n=1 Tax=Acidianus brierleyi TaxID=41673 RepID=A0A2U9IGE9_9CREN|nr:DUF61 family protein [Acidianus brierleyi]AWR95004.1 DUF61 family protein [Acidianus brierleyi]